MDKSEVEDDKVVPSLGMLQRGAVEVTEVDISESIQGNLSVG